MKPKVKAKLKADKPVYEDPAVAAVKALEKHLLKQDEVLLNIENIVERLETAAKAANPPAPAQQPEPTTPPATPDPVGG